MYLPLTVVGEVVKSVSGKHDLAPYSYDLIEADIHVQGRCTVAMNVKQS